ncbi:hypothetical protein [Mucilaginibacter psychrotolerans]|uniref:Uncharacterized protein n=1 Tax=Mucilaginibacter psychrotolerans TaxID=1524096 RepID=A0A4Y8SMA3_9SPHI|nr:hypothetical protein [Mucilaginibacter psychrotolerans]TFF40179.1 hypothetical protein E2R66_02700 [Mucilaginibacter psychrotolerans]
MLLPRICKIIGRILWFPALVLAAMVQLRHYVIPFLDFHKPAGRVSIFVDRGYDYSDEVTTTLFVLTLVFLAFGKRKDENALISKIRQYAFYWAASITWATTAMYFILMNFFDFIAPSRLFDLFVILGNLFIVYNFLVPIIVFFPVFWYLRSTIKHGDQLKPVYLVRSPAINILGKCATLLFMLVGIITGLFFTSNNSYPVIFTLFPLVIALWVCAKEPHEDKALFATRLNAVQLSIFVHYLLFILVYWVVYGWDYADVLGCSVVSSQLIFLVVFFWMRYKAPKMVTEDSVE